DPNLYERAAHPCHKDAFLPPGEMLVMHVSNFRPVKRIADVIRIFARIHQRVRSKLVLVGDGPERPIATAEADALGITDRVIFLGKQDSVAELLTCADLLLLPSQNESFGLVALEAMASGVPVVASRAGGLPEVVEDGVTGHLGEVGDVESMAEMGISILSDNRRWLAMSIAAQTVAAERFGVDVIVPQYERYYQRVLANDSAPAAEPLLAAAGDD
ncbi:MAG TPA: glycosyltransferase, partial [Longimicrobium sp.]|nr:glycosyltransferase [Longimicrobium sp.]